MQYLTNPVGAAAARECTLERDQTGIRYWVAGEAGAPTVVFTHGATLDHGAFDDQVGPLVAAGYRCISWDMRGHGGSQPLPGDRFTLAQAARDLQDLLDEAGVDRCVLVGQSFGGFVAQSLLRRAPERVAALVLIGTPPLGEEPIDSALPLRERVLNRMRPTLLRLWPERHLRRVLPAALSSDAQVRSYVARATAPMSKSAIVAVTRAALEGLSHAGVVPPVPTLLAYGARETARVDGRAHPSSRGSVRLPRGARNPRGRAPRQPRQPTRVQRRLGRIPPAARPSCSHRRPPMTARRDPRRSGSPSPEPASYVDTRRSTTAAAEWGRRLLLAGGLLSAVNGATHFVLPLVYPAGGWAPHVEGLYEPVRWALYATTVFFGVLLVLAGALTVAVARATAVPRRLVGWVAGGMAGFWLLAAGYELAVPFPIHEARWALPAFSLIVAGLYLAGLWLRLRHCGGER